LKEKEAAVVIERMGQVNWSPGKDNEKTASTSITVAAAPATAAPIK
jgi:hypothetical protein